MIAPVAGIVSVFTGGVRLAVKAKPGQKRPRPPRIIAVADDTRAVEIAVAAAAEGGKANQAILATLATAIGLRRADLEIRAGATGRLKLIEIHGDAVRLQAKVTTWLQGLSAPAAPP